MQAAILRAKLPHLHFENGRRRSHARRYRELLAGAEIGLPAARSDVRHVYHQFVIRTKQRDLLREHLRDFGVSSAIHYPVPVHRQPAYAGRVPTAGELAHSDAAAGEILSLPMYPELSSAAVDAVGENIQKWVAQKQ